MFNVLADKCQQSRVGSTVSRVLAALDALDRHHFDKWDDCYNLDILYRKIFEVRVSLWLLGDECLEVGKMLWMIIFPRLVLPTGGRSNPGIRTRVLFTTR